MQICTEQLKTLIDMIIQRDLKAELRSAAQETPVVAILGPRQSGKTTLARQVFSQHAYYNLEDLETRRRVEADPKGFLKEHLNGSGLILDEVQHIPDLFSYVQVMADTIDRPGFFVLTGSQNFALHQGISQSLAGRISLLTLLPFSLHELTSAGLLPRQPEELVFSGGYPRVYQPQTTIERIYKNYTKTYIEQDVHTLKQVKDLLALQDFMEACAARTGQVLNLSSLSQDLGVALNTIKSWLSVLVASYIVFLVKPYYERYGKRLTKSPKLYFVDTGLACYLLGLKKPDDLKHHYLKGALFETLIMSDLYKQLYNIDVEPQKHLYYWRDSAGHEVDALIARQPEPAAIEIKTSATVMPSFFAPLDTLNRVTKITHPDNYVIYGGHDIQRWPKAQVMGWAHSGTLIASLLDKQ